MKGKRLLAPLAAALLAASVFAGCSGEGPASSAAESVVSQASQASQPQSQIGAAEDFEAYFAENPLDKAYAEQSINAVTTVDMVALENRFVDLWEAEIENAYQRLLSLASPEEQSQVEREQTEWSAGKQAALDEITDNAHQNGGTMAAVKSASDVRVFYRERARALYERLYSHDPAYSYAYSNGEGWPA